MGNVLTKKKGFTIIEFMVVIAILSVAMVLTLPDFSKWILSTKMKNVAESIALGLKQAKGNAIRNNWTAYFYLNEDGSWVVSKNSGKGLIVSAGMMKINNKMKITVNPIGANTIIFDHMGLIISDFQNSPNKSTIVDPSEALSDYGVGPINEITIGLIDSDEAINDIKIKIGEGGSVVTCIDFKIDNNLPNNCKNIEM